MSEYSRWQMLGLSIGIGLGVVVGGGGALVVYGVNSDSTAAQNAVIDDEELAGTEALSDDDAEVEFPKQREVDDEPTDADEATDDAETMDDEEESAPADSRDEVRRPLVQGESWSTIDGATENDGLRECPEVDIPDPTRLMSIEQPTAVWARRGTEALLNSDDETIISRNGEVEVYIDLTKNAETHGFPEPCMSEVSRIRGSAVYGWMTLEEIPAAALHENVSLLSMRTRQPSREPVRLFE